MSDDPQDSVFLVTSSSPDEQGFGTAYAFDRSLDTSNRDIVTHFLTCKHVVTAVGGPNRVKIGGFRAEVIASGSEGGLDDLAVLRAGGLDEIPCLGLDDAGQTGSAVKIWGFRSFAQSFLIRPLRAHLGERIGLQSRQNPVRVVAWDLTIEGVYDLEVGYSGGPIIDENSGNVIGLATYRLGGRKGVALSIRNLESVWPGMPIARAKAGSLWKHSTEADISSGEMQRLQRRKTEKAAQWDRLSKILSTLQESYDLEDNPLRRIRLEEDIKKMERERDELDEEIARIERRLRE